MPDLLSGSEVDALDTPPTATDTEPGAYTCTNTSFGVGTTGGTYADCGVAFLAPTTGRVMILYAARLGNNTDGQSCHLTPVVRDGSTVGSGSTIVAASVENMIDIQAANASGNGRAGAHLVVTGLTPGAAYNVRLEHSVTANTGNIQSRTVTVIPLP